MIRTAVLMRRHYTKYRSNIVADLDQKDTVRKIKIK